MYAIVDIAGQQFKVTKNQKVYVHRLDAMEGDKLEIANVLLIDDNGKITVGAPSIDGARVAVKVLAHLKGEKVLVFKKKRRKGYQKMNGHRQYLSQVLVQGILGKGETLKPEDETAEVKKPAKAKKAVAEGEEKKAPAKKAAPKKTTEAAAKKAPAKKTTKKKEE